jgi:hydroxymethylbilane synthase
MAISQSGDVARLVTERTGRPVEIVGISTLGDASREQVTQIGATGIFVSELREALLRGEVDFAVHSLKDLPTGAAPGIALAAIPPRDDPRDVLVGHNGAKLADLPSGARIGTGSARRAEQITALRSDVRCVPVRGNANTRLAKVHDGGLDAVVLAYAGLARIGRTELVTEVFEPDDMVPCPGQGALAVECRSADAGLAALLASVDHPATRAAVTAERSLLAALEAGCSAPVGAYASLQAGSNRLHLDAVVLGSVAGSLPPGVLDARTAVGRMVIRERGEADAVDAARLGRDLAARMLGLGAAGLMRVEKTNGNDAHD